MNSMGPVLSKWTVGVIGSSRHPHHSLAGDVGQLLAELEVNVLTGGGGGVMEAVCRAFVRARRGRGVCIGIIPCSEADPGTPKAGYPNEFIELPIFTHLPLSGEQGQESLSRNHINVLSCAAIMVLPGSEGTAAEASLALRYRKPVVAYLADDAFGESLPKTIPRAEQIEDVRRFLCECLSGVNDPYDLNRFVRAQDADYDQAVSEIRNGRKRSHWMWYIFPQFEGLGSSSISKQYAIRSLAEARAYLRHPVLGPRLWECAEAVLAVTGRSASEIFGYPDDLKLRSSATLFDRVSPTGSVFERLLNQYFQGVRDDKTLRLLGAELE